LHALRNDSRRRIAADNEGSKMRPWRRRYYRNLLNARRGLRELAAVVEKRQAAPRRFRLLSAHEAEAIVGSDLLAALAAVEPAPR
jgi:hypothetical protein